MFLLLVVNYPCFHRFNSKKAFWPEKWRTHTETFDCENGLWLLESSHFDLIFKRRCLFSIMELKIYSLSHIFKRETSKATLPLSWSQHNYLIIHFKNFHFYFQRTFLTNVLLRTFTKLNQCNKLILNLKLFVFLCKSQPKLWTTETLQTKLCWHFCLDIWVRFQSEKKWKRLW